ncbi:MAG: N-acetylmuramoyl-L-alanine amidase [Clostridiales Family XIII bacterium]|jgi:N-acetylmuramoyl-L-alanine amidase|nr:N-acetylmuramoyl-L-alanine amidase [Clostridiales Family XIII bacterium]
MKKIILPIIVLLIVGIAAGIVFYSVNTEEKKIKIKDIAVEKKTTTQSSVYSKPSIKKPDKKLLLEGVVIGIDAGHQLYGNNEQEKVSPDSSATKPKVTSGTSGISTGTGEHELNLIIAKKLKNRLTKKGAEVYMTREKAAVDISNMERAEMMNEIGADLVIRIHANGGDSSLKGAMMLVPTENTYGIEEESMKAGKIIFNEFLKATNANDLGIIERSNLTGFNWSKVPVCLIEMGYMSNPEEDKLLETNDYRNKVAKGLSDGIEKWWTER